MHQSSSFPKGMKRTTSFWVEKKTGNWFAGSKFRNPNFPLRIAASELGNWMSYLQICVNLCRGVKKMHAMGLAHSDLSYNNVLVDPVSKSACMIDLDGLVVPGLFPAEVIGTAEFIAPEVMATKHLNKSDPNRKLPREGNRPAFSSCIDLYVPAAPSPATWRESS
jgi:hypothetical protein